jgi:hypothetical protein
MATTTPDDAECEPARPLWDLREDEKRLLAITVVGGLTANVGLVLVVGLGLLIAKVARAHGGFVTLIVLACGVAVYSFTAVVLTLLPSRQRNTFHVIRLGFVGTTILAWSVVLLAAIGYAAGVR